MSIESKKKHTKLFIALALISISVTSPGSAQPRWRYKAEMPTSRRSFTASVVNGKIYAIGGLQSTGSNQDPIRTVDMYDPSTGIWTQMADNPLPMYEHSEGVVDSKIYIMGGYPRVPTAPPSAIFQVYDPATDTWKRKADMPVPRANHCAAVVDGKIYLFGGFCFECPVPGRLLSTVSIYDPATDTWTQGADMPFPWAMPRASVVNGKIYACTGFGGHGGGASWEQHPILAVYDPSTDTWTEGAALPFGRNDAQVAVVDARIYVMGGAIEERINGAPGRIADVIMYDPVVDAWTDAPPMSTPRRAQQACVMDNTIFSIGGAMNAPPPDGTAIISKMIEVLDLKPVVDFNGETSLQALDKLLAMTEGKEALAIGPGLGLGEEASGLMRQLVQDTKLPIVIDADGLTALCGYTHILDRQADRQIVMTPHPGEMARLTGLSTDEIQADRFTVARDFAVRHQVVLVLKGARSLTASPDGQVHVNKSGHAGLASGGMGDVLTGLIGSLLAQGLTALDAATLGVYLHGLAADRLLATFGNAGLLASDVLNELPAARQALSMES